VSLPRHRSVFGFLLLFSVAPLLAEDVHIAAGTVEDQRSSDSRMGGLTIELKLTGESIKDVKALRATLKSAKDDLGSVLYKPAKNAKDERVDYEEFSPDRRPGPRLTLVSPGRDASRVDVTAEVELFIPARDPSTRQRFEGFLTRPDKPIFGSGLKAAKVEITPLSPASYKAREQQNRPTKEELVEEGKKHGATDAEIKQAIGLMEALASLGGEEPSETSVLLETKDPEGKIMSIDIVRPDGTELHSTSRTSSGRNEDKLLKIDLSEKPPADAALLVTLRTAKSTMTVPVKFKEIALP
jgi:hypothetical protein